MVTYDASQGKVSNLLLV